MELLLLIFYFLPGFAHLLQSYLEVVKREDIASLESSLSDMFTIENRKVVTRSIEVYENKMSLPDVSSEEEFQQIHEAAVEEAKQELNKFYVKHEKSPEEYWNELKVWPVPHSIIRAG